MKVRKSPRGVIFIVRRSPFLACSPQGSWEFKTANVTLFDLKRCHIERLSFKIYFLSQSLRKMAQKKSEIYRSIPYLIDYAHVDLLYPVLELTVNAGQKAQLTKLSLWMNVNVRSAI